MKINITLITLLLFCSCVVVAQQNQQKEISAEEQMKMFASRLAQKIVLTKSQKDSVALIYLQYMDDIQKYRAENNGKVLSFLMTSREEKIKKLLRDDKKYDQYLLFLEDMKKQRESQQGQGNQQQGGQHNSMGNGRGM
jgi:hypothetical protein